MADLLNYESDNPSIVEMLEHGIHFSQHLLNNFNIVTGQSFPVIIQGDHPLVHMIKWGIPSPISVNGPELTYIYGPTIEKQESLKTLMKHQRVLIPVQKFVHRRKGQGKDVVIQHPRNKVLWMVGMWSESTTGEKGFALITRDADDSMRNLIRRIPVFLVEKPDINKWLDRSVTTLSEISDIIATPAQSAFQTNGMSIGPMVG